MKFNNKPNELVSKENIGEREFFISRSVAVVGTVIALKDNEEYVLMNQRGTETPDFPGHWNMPCGYLDWDETATQAVKREVYEECGLDIDELLENNIKIHVDIDQPWFVHHDPSTSNRQNVTLRFGVMVFVEDLPELTSENSEENEVSELKWVKVSDIDNYKCAFGHEKIVKEYKNILHQK